MKKVKRVVLGDTKFFNELLYAGKEWEQSLYRAGHNEFGQKIAGQAEMRRVSILKFYRYQKIKYKLYGKKIRLVAEIIESPKPIIRERKKK